VYLCNARILGICISFQNCDSFFNLKKHWQLNDMGWFRLVGFWARGGIAPKLPRAIRVGPLANEGNKNGGGVIQEFI